MKEYKHFVDPVPVKTNWTDGMKFELVDSIDKLKSTFQPQKFLAWDTETTGLNPEEDHIVGFSYTYDGVTGYYCPVDHIDLALGKESLQIFYKMLRLAKMTLLYNARFDIRFMEYSGFDMEPVKYIDIQNIVWLADTNMSFPSLKWAEKHFLGWEALHFEDTLGSAQNFRFVKARDAVFYATTDCLGTYNLFPKVVQYYRDSGLAARLDNECLFILMRLENEKQNLSTKYLTDLNNKCLEDLSNLERYLYKEAGHQFKIGSGRELTKVFLKLGIDTGERTKSGDMVTSIDKIENYLSSHESEFLSKLIEYKELFKFQNSYVKKLLDISHDPHPVRFSYKTVAVPTGRLSCGTDSKNTFFSKLNYQSIPKPHSHMFHCRKATDEEVANGSDLCGYIFYDGDDDTPMIEGMSPVRNIRSAFVPDEGSVVLSVDMCAESGSPVYSDKGYIGLSELKVGDYVASPHGMVKVIRVIPTGLKKVCKITTNGQSLYCSEDHPLLVDGVMVEAGKVGRSLIIENIHLPNTLIKEREEFKERFSFLKEYASLSKKADLIQKYGLLDIFTEGLRKYTRSYVSECCGVLSNSFSHILNYLGLPATGKLVRFKKDLYYNNPFIVSNPTSAYLVGYILGDGNISIRNDKCHRDYKVLNISSKDRNHLIRIASIFGKDVKVRFHKRNLSEWWSIDIPDSDICNSLIRIGIATRKSELGSKIDLDWLGGNYRHFIRGLFDSDGYVRITSGLNLSVHGHSSYIQQIYDHDPDFWIKKEEFGLFSITLKGNVQEKKFIYEYLYKDATIWLQRKRDRIDEWYKSSFGDLYMHMYDITVDSEDHLYYLNGLVSHNCAEELRIVANIFKEPVWIRAFNNGEDLHKANAVKIFGEENYCKEKRKLAKVAGFGILYGTSAYGFNQKFPEMTLDECEDFIAKFKRSIPNIVSGQQRAIQRAKKTGFVTTFFGRPRRVASYFKSTDPKDRSFACRTTENTLVQGAAADVLKLVLVRLWAEVFKPYQGRVRFMGTIHDEVNMSVPKEILTEVVQKVVKCMTIKLPEWPVTLECSVSIGKDFGSLFPFILKDGELIPDCEKAKEEKAEVKVVEEETSTIEDDGIMFDI